MSNTSGDESSHADWSRQLAFVNWFKDMIDYLKAEDCVSEDLFVEARKKIDEAMGLIITASEDHDKDKLDRADNLIEEIKQAFFSMLDYCYNKYAGPRMRQLGQGGGKA